MNNFRGGMSAESAASRGRPKNALRNLVSMGLLAASFLGDAAASSSWKEEVLLHDGTRVVVERTVQRGGRREVGQEPPIREQSLRFKPPGGNVVVWKDAYTADIGTANFLPMLLDIHSGAIYLVVHPMGCLSYNKWGRPNPPYVVFKHGGDEWRRIALQELPKGIKSPNLIFSSPDMEARKVQGQIVSAEAIKALYAGYQQPEFRSILREPIPNAGGEGCTEKVSNGKGGWLGIDWFTTQPDLQACLKVCTQKRMGAEFCPCRNLFQGK